MAQPAQSEGSRPCGHLALPCRPEHRHHFPAQTRRASNRLHFLPRSRTNPPGGRPDTRRRSENSAALAALYEAIAKLNEVEKALITLFLEDLSYDQMAEVLGVSASHVGVMLHRVKKKLAALAQEVLL